MGKNLFFNGVADLLVLSILDHHDSYMYEIVKSISGFSGGLLNISQNTIYTVAYKLENEGKISEYSKRVGRKRTRVYYRLEPKGKAYLDEIAKSYRETTDGIHNVFATLAGMEKIQVTEEVEVSDEQDLQSVSVGDVDVVSVETEAGAQVLKKPCFGC